MTHDDRTEEGRARPPRSGIDQPQPGARQEMPLSPPRTKYILAGLAAVAAIIALIAITGIV